MARAGRPRRSTDGRTGGGGPTRAERGRAARASRPRRSTDRGGAPATIHRRRTGLPAYGAGPSSPALSEPYGAGPSSPTEYGSSQDGRGKCLPVRHPPVAATQIEPFLTPNLLRRIVRTCEISCDESSARAEPRVTVRDMRRARARVDPPGSRGSSVPAVDPPGARDPFTRGSTRLGRAGPLCPRSTRPGHATRSRAGRSARVVRRSARIRYPRCSKASACEPRCNLQWARTSARWTSSSGSAYLA